MTGALLAGAVVGVGLFLLVRALFPGRPGLAASLAAFDASVRRREDQRARGSADGSGTAVDRRTRVGRLLARFYADRGWEQRSVRADLAMLDRSFESHLAAKFLLPAGVLVCAPLLAGYCALMGVPVAFPVWLCALLAVVFFFLPDVQLRQEAARRRRDFRHVVGAFLDLVSMNLAGGRGVPEALMTAARIGDGWATQRIRDALANARITGRTPWQALGALGAEVGVSELEDLAGALALVADDGAKVRQSLGARAASMRSRELSELEGKAGERSQSMLVAQLLFCTAFLLFLTFPAVMRVLAA